MKSASVQREFTGHDAETMMATFARLGLKSTPDATGFASIQVASLTCTHGDGSSRWDLETGINCELVQDQETRKSEAESEGIYRLVVKNGAKEQVTGSGKTMVQMLDVRCVAYTATHGTSKCFYKQ